MITCIDIVVNRAYANSVERSPLPVAEDADADTLTLIPTPSLAVQATRALPEHFVGEADVLGAHGPSDSAMFVLRPEVPPRQHGTGKTRIIKCAASLYVARDDYMMLNTLGTAFAGEHADGHATFTPGQQVGCMQPPPQVCGADMQDLQRAEAQKCTSIVWSVPGMVAVSEQSQGRRSVHHIRSETVQSIHDGFV